jgi:hypothetical protein
MGFAGNTFGNGTNVLPDDVLKLRPDPGKRT